jgi:hypothetical protein
MPTDAQTRDRLKRSLTATAGKIDKLKADAAEAKTVLDALVLEGKTAGFKYRELSEITGRSIAWVQASLVRSGYVATKGPRTKAKTAEDAA